MPKQRLYFEYIDNKLIPYWYVLTFQPCQINWDKHIFYFNAIKPFEYIEREHFDDSIISMSIFMSDLIFNHNITGHIGLNLSSIKKRIIALNVDPDVVLQFILQANELDEFLALLPKERKMEFQLSQTKREIINSKRSDDQ